MHSHFVLGGIRYYYKADDAYIKVLLQMIAGSKVEKIF